MDITQNVADITLCEFNISELQNILLQLITLVIKKSLGHILYSYLISPFRPGQLTLFQMCDFFTSRVE